LRRHRRPHARTPARPHARTFARPAGPAAAPAEVLLRCDALTRRWGGLVAMNDVGLSFERGCVHAVIGTNARATRR
jgi:hypothetical protein